MNRKNKGQKNTLISNKINRKTFREYITSYIMVLPAMAFLLTFVVYPMVNIIHLSLYRGNAARPYKDFLGLKNYRDLFLIRKDFLVALKNTAYYTVAVVVLLITFAVVFAVWMQKNRFINKIAQTIFFTPHLIATISSAFIWSWLYDSNSYGLFNSVLKLFNIAPVRWLDTSATAMNSIIVMNVWKSIGYYAIIILSALKSISPDIYEAAELDNSSTIKTFFKITLPMLSPQLFFLLITITTGSFKVFDSIRIMTAGGPGTSTQVLAMFIYDNAFQLNNSLGIGSAAGVVLMIILIIVTLLDFKGLEKKVHYQ